MASANVAPGSGIRELGAILDSPEIAKLIDQLEDTRWTGRPGNPVRVMVGMALVKSSYALPTWTRGRALGRRQHRPATGSGLRR